MRAEEALLAISSKLEEERRHEIHPRGQSRTSN
jgi:hypothetical protein